VPNDDAVTQTEFGKPILMDAQELFVVIGGHNPANEFAVAKTGENASAQNTLELFEISVGMSPPMLALSIESVNFSRRCAAPKMSFKPSQGFLPTMSTKTSIYIAGLCGQILTYSCDLSEQGQALIGD
jgi:hypothetical protein